MQESETGHTMKKGHNRKTDIEAVVVQVPHLQRAAGHVKHLSCLTLGEPLGVQIVIPFKEVSTFGASPALVAIMLAALLCLDYRCHSYLLCRSPTI